MKKQGHDLSAKSSIQKQREQSSWATNDLYQVKRKYSVDADADGDDDGRPSSRNKRGRGGEA